MYKAQVPTNDIGQSQCVNSFPFFCSLNTIWELAKHWYLKLEKQKAWLFC